MTVYTKVDISGVTYNDIRDIEVTKNMSEHNASSSFRFKFDNPAGRHKSDFTVGNEVEIWAEIDDITPDVKIFTGILEDIEFDGVETRERLVLAGRDYTARLQDRTVEPEVYNNLPAGSIVKDIINKYTDNITVTNVDDSPTTVPRIVFNHTSVYDAVKELADLSGFFFYVDTNKDLHFKEKSSTSSSLTFNSGNILQADFKEERDTIFNEVWVYGDRYLDNFSETFTAGSPLGGSVFTLLYKPHNTEVTVDSTDQFGGIFGMAVVPVSGTDFLVNFHDKQIVFISGTDLGYSSIPASGASVAIKYDRSLPIVKVGRNNSSIGVYGKRVKKIQDKNIKDPDIAVEIVNQQLDEFSTPKKEGNITVKDVIDVTPGETCTVDVPWHNVNNQTYDIVEAKYKFTPHNNLNNSPLNITVNKKIGTAADKIKELERRINRLEGQDIDTADVITRLEFSTGSMQVVGSYWQVSTRTLGSSFVLGNPGTNPGGVQAGGILGSVVASGINFLGDSRSALVVQQSGGTF